MRRQQELSVPVDHGNIVFAHADGHLAAAALHHGVRKALEQLRFTGFLIETAQSKYVDKDPFSGVHEGVEVGKGRGLFAEIEPQKAVVFLQADHSRTVFPVILGNKLRVLRFSSG